MMKEKISAIVNDELVLIGHTCMMAPTAINKSGQVFKMFQLHPLEIGEVGDIFFFEYCKNDEDWKLLTEFAFVNLDGPSELQDLYMTLLRTPGLKLCDFIKLVLQKYYSKRSDL